MASIASEYLADMLAPEQFAAAIFGVTLAFTILAGNSVGIRSWARIRNKKFGNDDYLMCTALVVNVVQNAIVMHGTFVGIGSPDSKLNSDLEAEGRKYLFLWQIFYTINLVFIKTSILTTLRRIDKEKRCLYIVWGLMLVVSLLGIAGFITLLAKCHPIQANWTEEGTCMDSSVFVALSKTAYAFDVASDLAMAAMSTFLMWDPRMKLRSKIMTGSILGLGVVASIASVVRTVYTDAYSSEDNYLYKTGKIVLWTIIECGVGIIAGSLPMVKGLTKRRRLDKKFEELEWQHAESMVSLPMTAVTRNGRR